ncbi:autotransporter secretion outer membrane proteinTamA [Porphyrobacter sp. LM 6]|nr:autotransporter secretion outer membrane proteinTamA [Porphyrobacter sp. LM 6]
MASLSSFREAEHSRARASGFLFREGWGHGASALMLALALAFWAATTPLAAQSQPAAEVSEDAPPPEPVEVPQNLADLIPDAAVTDPEAWAAAGVDAMAVEPDLASPDLDPVLAELDAALTPGSPDVDPGLLPETEAMLAESAFDVPEPLPSDPDLEALAMIAAPVLGDVPELTETKVSSTLVLALPKNPDAFPERAEFVQRFRDLSTLRGLDEGKDSAPQVAARARSDEILLGDILRTYGYYGGDVVRQLSGGRRAREEETGEVDDSASEPSVRFDILPGERYRFGRIDLGALPTLPEPDASRLTQAFGIASGDPLYADRIIEREIELRVALGESGYPFAAVAEPELLIDHARAEGDLTLDVQPRGKYVFGDVTSSDPRFLSGRHLAEIARFDEGDVFQQSLETDLRRAIIATGLVSSVTVTPRETRAPQDGQPGEVALDVAFERAPLRTIAGAIGYGTEDGFKLETRWEHRNLFPPEGALRLRGILGTRETLASIGVRRNNFRGRDQVLSVDLFASDITTEAVDARGFGMRTTFEKVSNILFQKPVSWQLGGELLYTDERNRTVRIGPGGPLPRRTYTIGGLFGSITLDASDDLLDPSEGYRATMFLAPEVSRAGGAETFYLRAQADASAYQLVGSTVLAGRVRAATIQGAPAEDIAPSRRLYGGGGASVRGYGFQGVGPRDTVGNPVGGASLVEFALEARVETPLLGGAVEVVPFLDAGSVGRDSTPDFADIRFGAGIGIRYKTTFGPIRVDVATPLNPTQFDSPVVVYVSLGQAF